MSLNGLTNRGTLQVGLQEPPPQIFHRPHSPEFAERTKGLEALFAILLKVL